MAGDDARDIFAVLNGDAQRLFNAPDDLVGDGRPNQGTMTQRPPSAGSEPCDGRRTHTAATVPPDALKLCSLWSTSTERTTSRHKGASSSPPHGRLIRPWRPRR